MPGMKWREFIKLGGAVPWPLAARAQQPALPVATGVHPDRAQETWPRSVRVSPKRAMSKARTYRLNTVGRRGQYDRLPVLAVDLVRRQVVVIVASGSTGMALAAAESDAA
jgi:putative ABC transport system substrate-binding protein